MRPVAWRTSLVLLHVALATVIASAAFHSRPPSLHVEHRRRTDLPSSLGDACGIEYEGAVFRPPAEWRSLILQVTIGCSWNRCTFCEMYQEKSFRAKPVEEVIAEMDRVVEVGGASYVRDVFLADGDAMTLPTGMLVRILDAINDRFPRVRRISSYCLPRNVRGKSVDALSKLKSRGLSHVYVGCESGSDTVLEAVEKGETYETSLSALAKLKDAGIKRSVMILIGLGGREHSYEHACLSASLCSEARPDYLSLLTTSFPRGKGRVEAGYRKLDQDTASSFEELSARESLKEMKVFLEACNIPGGKTIFRSDHASNYFVLKGRLGRDKERLLAELQTVLDGDESKIRQQRGL